MAKSDENDLANGTSDKDKEKYLMKDEYKENELVEMKNTKNLSEKPELKRLTTTDYEDYFKTTPLTNDTSCGYGIFRNSFLQK